MWHNSCKTCFFHCNIPPDGDFEGETIYFSCLSNPQASAQTSLAIVTNQQRPSGLKGCGDAQGNTGHPLNLRSVPSLLICTLHCACFQSFQLQSLQIFPGQLDPGLRRSTGFTFPQYTGHLHMLPLTHQVKHLSVIRSKCYPYKTRDRSCCLPGVYGWVGDVIQAHKLNTPKILLLSSIPSLTPSFSAKDITIPPPVKIHSS